MELSGYFAVVRRWWWTLLVAAWVAGLAGFYVASRIQPSYESSVKLLVAPLNTDADTLRSAGLLVQTYAQVVTTSPILGRAVTQTVTPTSMSADELGASTRVVANDVTRVLTITVRTGDPAEAAGLANSMADEMVTLVKSGVSRPEGALQIIQAAQPDPRPVAPQISLIVLLATAAGIIAALVLVLLIEYLGRSIRSRDELARLINGSVLGSVPAPSRDRANPRDLAGDGSAASTVYRVLAARIVYGDPEEVLHSLAVVDSESDTGSALVAINLGRALAKLGRRVVVIDGGVRNNLAALYGVEPVPGIRDVLSREVQPRAAMRIVGERLALIPAGFEGSELVDPDRARAVVQELLASADVVVVCAPPVQAGPSALSWARALDRTVLVARRDHARRDDVSAAAETLVHVGGRLSGAILTERPAPLARLLGRGRSGSAKTTNVPPARIAPAASPMASPIAPMATSGPAPTLVPSAAPYSAYRPSLIPSASSAPSIGSPSALRPTIIRASAPTPLPPPTIVPPPPAEPPAKPPSPRSSRSGSTRSTTPRPRSTGRSTTSRDDPSGAS